MLAASHVHWRAGSLRSFTATRKEAGLFCEPLLRKGEMFAYGRNFILKDPKGELKQDKKLRKPRRPDEITSDESNQLYNLRMGAVPGNYWTITGEIEPD